MQNPNESLTISPAGLALIKKWEGWYPKAYKDPVGVWTIGWGTTGSEARPGRTITKKQGEEFLRADLRDDEASVKRLVTVPLTQYEFDALVSFVYNCGAGNFSKSTLRKLINRGNKQAAAAQFVRWNKARDRETGEYITLRGLTNRRKDEAALFLRDPADEVPESDLDMEDQKPLENPHTNESTVTTEAPDKHSSPLLEVVANTDTFKGVVTGFTGLILVVSQTLEQIKDNSFAMLGVGLFAGALVSILYVKYRDTKEGR